MYLYLRYRLTGLPVDYQIKNISSPDVTNLLLEDLIIWTNYEIEVAAYNGAGLGTFSHKVTEWTLQGGKRSHHQCYSVIFSESAFICVNFKQAFYSRIMNMHDEQGWIELS